MLKGQSTIVGFILVTAIAIVIISVSMFWAIPLLEKTQDQQRVQRIEMKFFELHEAIKRVASTQSSLAMDFNIDRGLLSLDANNNTIIYSAQFDLTNPVPRKALLGMTDIMKVKELNIMAPGILGTDEPAVLIEQGSLELLLHYRPLNTTDGNCYRIKLIPGNMPGAGIGRHTIILTWKGENLTATTTTFGGVNCSTLLDQLVEFDVK
ncbi:MAG: hypothetical protein QW063_02515 [Candidatus Nanoarchaeia archaeon]